MKKYFFFDIDGTLAAGEPGKQYIPESTKLALKLLRENGHNVAIATGRSYAMAKQFLDIFDVDDMVSDGGNSITIQKLNQGIEPLDKQACIDLIEECKEKGYPWGFSPDDAMRRLCPDETFYEFTHDVYMDSVVTDDPDLTHYENIYKLYIACFAPDEQKLENLNRLPWCRYHKEYLFCEPTDKSKGIRRMMDYYGADVKDVVVFGDSFNDMSMFLKDEWTCIAMGNACDELKDISTYVTDDIKEDGIYNACKKFGWI